VRLLLLVAVLLAGCSSRRVPLQGAGAATQESLRIADGDFDRDPRAVSGAAAALDLDVAVRAFDEAYAGVEGAEGLNRLPPAGRIAEVRARLVARARWSPDELLEELVALFRCPDGHLAFGWGGHLPLRVEAFHEGPRPRAPAPLGDEAVTLVPGAVPRLVVRTFDSAAALELAALPSIARELRRLPAFVVDLRGNGGGNFGYAERFVLELTDRTLRRLDEREVVSVAAAEGRANSARRRLALGEVPAAAEPLFRAHVDALEAAAAALRARGGGRVERVATDGMVRGRAPGPLQARAVFLVDGGCASACEMAVALARQIPGVTVAGESTRGSMAAGEIALFRLPRSGVMISLGTRAFRDPLGGFAETRGFVPEVYLAGSDAAARAGALALEHDPVAPSRVESPVPTRVSSWK
jgi:Peptidase family S41